jgi:hypothetical protein
MSGDTTGKISKAESGTDWDRLRNMSDEEVHAAVVSDPDAHATDDEFWKTARAVVPPSKKTHSNLRFRRAVTRICFEACWLYRYQKAIEKLRSVEAVGTDFFQVSLTALMDAQLIRLIRLLEESSRVASFWYLCKANKKIVDAALARTGVDLEEVRQIAEKLPDIRNRTFVHIDKETVFDPNEIYQNAGIKTHQVEQACSALWELMKEIYRETNGAEFQADDYYGDDIPVLEKLRDGMESGEFLAR